MTVISTICFQLFNMYVVDIEISCYYNYLCFLNVLPLTKFIERSLAQNFIHSSTFCDNRIKLIVHVLGIRKCILINCKARHDSLFFHGVLLQLQINKYLRLLLHKDFLRQHFNKRFFLSKLNYTLTIYYNHMIDFFIKMSENLFVLFCTKQINKSYKIIYPNIFI